MVFVRNDSKKFRFCRAKCHRSFNKKRNPRKVAWTKAFRKTRGKEMSVDSTFEFEARRNRPVKYDRDLVSKTLGAMNRVQEIKETREKDFYVDRMKDSHVLKKEQARVELEKGVDLLAPAAAMDRQAVVKNVIEKEKNKRKAAKKTETAMDVN